MDGIDYMADKIIPFPNQKKNDIPPRYNIIDRFWFTTGGGINDIIGAVLIEDIKVNYVVGYLGTGTDEQRIAEWGAKLTRKQSEAIFGYDMPNYKRY